MRMTRWLFVSICAALLLLAACGDDDSNDTPAATDAPAATELPAATDLTLAEYFSELEPASQEYNTTLFTLDENVGVAFDEARSGSLEDTIEVHADYANDMRANTNDFVAKLVELDAPAGAQEAHDEAIEAGQELVAMYDSAIEEFDSGEALEGPPEAITGEAYTEATIRFFAACLALQDIAVTNAIDVDLGCSGGNGGEQTLAEYFAALAPLVQAYAGDLDALNVLAGEALARAQQAVDDPELENESVELYVSYIESDHATQSDFVGVLADQSPPPEAAEAHEEAVAAGRELVAGYEGVLAGLQSNPPETFEDAAGAVIVPAIGDARARFGASCDALQGIADANAIVVDLGCSEIGWATN